MDNDFQHARHRLKFLTDEEKKGTVHLTYKLVFSIKKC